MASARGRIASVDALRGLTVAAMILVNNPGDWGHVWWPLEHAAWNGCTPTDLIFPMFLFLVGTSLALAGGPRLDSGADTTALQRAWLWRAARIVGLGLLLHLVAHLALGTPAFRVMGVLQRIGLCFGVVGVVYLHSTAGQRWALWAALLLGYGALLAGNGPLTETGSIAARWDAQLLGLHAYRFDAATGLGHEPEGLLSTLGALATTLLGLACGEWLRHRRAQPLAVAAAALLLGGWLAQGWLPWNKALWTPSYVLWAGGWSCLALLAAHFAVDRWGAPPIGRRFGVNAITAYAGAWLMSCLLDGSGWGGPLYQAGFAWITPWTGPVWPSHLWALAGVVIWWGVVRWMDSRRLVITI